MPVADDAGGGSGSEGPDWGDVIPDDDYVGAVATTGVPTFSVVRPPDSGVPSQLSVVTEPNDGTEWFSFVGDEVAVFMVLLRITSAQAATEYRFEGAVPDDVTVHTDTDGSLQFVDADGIEVGFISPAWAFDANGDAVPTRYSIDGTTLIQTVDHHGAVYPVIADPSWWETAAGWVGAAATAVAVTCAMTVCAPAAVPAATAVAVVSSAVFVVGQMIPDSSTGGGQRPSNTCNMRNRSGC